VNAPFYRNDTKRKLLLVCPHERKARQLRLSRIPQVSSQWNVGLFDKLLRPRNASGWSVLGSFSPAALVLPDSETSSCHSKGASCNRERVEKECKLGFSKAGEETPSHAENLVKKFSQS
jgi:hypothetical protein